MQHAVHDIVADCGKAAMDADFLPAMAAFAGRVNRGACYALHLVTR